ncbi:MAG: DUF1002 domain-containing protein [Clostridium sp.]
MTTKRTAILTIFIFIFIIPSIYSFASPLDTVALGKNINPKQKKEILDFFNPPSGKYTLLNINEKSLVPYKKLLPDTTKNKHLSCVYLQPITEGGVDIKTVNLTYVSNWLLSDALIVSGIDNLNAIIAAPSQVSGLYSYPNIILGYEDCTGKTISPEKIKLSLALIDLAFKISYSENISQTRLSMIFATIEDEVINGSNVSKVVNSTFESHDLSISNGETNDIISLMSQIQQESYNKTTMNTSLNELNFKIKCKLQKNGQLYGVFNNMDVLIYRIKNKLVDYFSSKSSSTSILKNINENSTLGKDAVRTGDSTLVDIIN